MKQKLLSEQAQQSAVMKLQGAGAGLELQQPLMWCLQLWSGKGSWAQCAGLKKSSDGWRETHLQETKQLFIRHEQRVLINSIIANHSISGYRENDPP